MSKTKLIICPYCGETQPAGDACRSCAGLFEPLSRQATHNQMGPWFIRDEQRPFQPGCSYETLVKLVQRGQVTKYSILRGPTTRQFWTVARHVPGVAHLLGYCHSCDAQVDPGDHGCHACGVAFGAYLDRNFLGLPDIRPLPWEVDPNEEMRQAASSHGMDWARPVRGGSLSSFATDEELYGQGAFDPAPLRQSGGGSSTPLHGRAHVPHAAHVAETSHRGGSTLADPAAGSAAAGLRAGPSQERQDAAGLVTHAPRSSAADQARQRIMRRRARQHKRMMRIIAITLVVLIIILTIVNGSKIAALLGGE